jgi:cytochrome c5
MKKYAIIFGLFILAACAAKKANTSKAESQETTVEVDYLSSAQKIDQSFTSQRLSIAKNIYETECRRCHPLKKPASRSNEEWSRIVPDMVKKAKRKGAEISQQQESDLLTYILALKSAGT